MIRGQEHRQPSFITIAVFLALAFPGTAAYSQDDKLDELEMEANRYARELLEFDRVKDMTGALRTISRMSIKTRDVYYDNIMRVAMDYIETSEDGPFGDSARVLLCSTKSCTPATSSIQKSFSERQAADQIYRVGGAVSEPQMLSAPRPPGYTRIARQARIQGVVELQTIIDKQGAVTIVEVLRGLPLGLTEKTAESMKQWKFTPATLEGGPVAVYYPMTIDWRLQ